MQKKLYLNNLINMIFTFAYTPDYYSDKNFSIMNIMLNCLGIYGSDNY
jgi:hypothetical protein